MQAPAFNLLRSGRLADTWVRKNLVVIMLALWCVVMALLAIEQDRTISNQRDLIRSLFRDSMELNAMKIERQQSTRHR